jgi:hypothetical protein
MPLTVDIPERLDISWPHHHAIFHRRDFITHFLIPSVRALLKITLMHQWCYLAKGAGKFH